MTDSISMISTELRNSIIVTNSEFNKKMQALGIKPLVLSLPVNIDPFQTRALISDQLGDMVLVLTKIVPYKRSKMQLKLPKY